MKRILIVDDEPLILEELSKALYKLCDFCGEIKTAETGEGAIVEISLCFYDICFLDINLPDLSGLDVMKKINEISPETSVAIMTADFISDDIKRILIEGASLFIPKPFNLSQIKVFVKQALEGDREVLNLIQDMKERRQFKRRPFMKTINYSVNIFNLGELKGDIIDISHAGMGIRTDYPLKPGYELRFKKGIGHKSGIVKWSMMVNNNNIYRVGIEFI